MLCVGIGLAILLELTGRRRDGPGIGVSRLRRRVSGEQRSVPVPDGLAGLRLDQAISRLFGLSRTAAATLVEAGDAVLDGQPGGSPRR